MIAPTETPANDVHEAAPADVDVILRGRAQAALSRALDALVSALANLAMPEFKRQEVADAYLKVERVGMAAARAIDQATTETP